MALQGNLDLASTAQSPPPTFNIRTQNRDFNTEPLSSDEAALFENQFNTLINDFDSRVIADMLQQRQEVIGQAAAMAKNEFDEKLFGGINAADNEIAFDVLRAGHIRAKPGTDAAHSSASTGDVLNDWYFEPGSSGWNDWIGDGTSSNDYTVSSDQVLLVLGIIDQDPTTEISGLNVEYFGRNVDMLPKDLNTARTLDNENDIMVQPLPTMMATDRDRINIRLRHDYVDRSQPRLLGVTFGVGDYMNTEDFS
jgi:hypothetical protein